MWKKMTYKDLDTAVLQRVANKWLVECLWMDLSALIKQIFFHEKLGLLGEFNASLGRLLILNSHMELEYPGLEIKCWCYCCGWVKKTIKWVNWNKGGCCLTKYIMQTNWVGIGNVYLLGQLERERQALGDKSNKEWVTILCCGNTAGNHK